MKLLVELERRDGEWFGRLLSPDRVELAGVDYMTREETIEHCKGFVESAADILGV